MQVRWQKGNLEKVQFLNIRVLRKPILSFVVSRLCGFINSPAPKDGFYIKKIIFRRVGNVQFDNIKIQECRAYEGFVCNMECGYMEDTCRLICSVIHVLERYNPGLHLTYFFMS